MLVKIKRKVDRKVPRRKLELSSNARSSRSAAKPDAHLLNPKQDKEAAVYT